MTQTSDIHGLLDRVESARLEFKGSIREPGELAKLIGAFANTDGGVIVIGMRGSAEIIGTDVERVRQLYERAIEKLEPRPHTSFARINVDGKPIAVIEVDKANGLVLAESGAYTRAGASTQPMTANEVSRALILTWAGRPDHLEVLAGAIVEQTNKIEGLRSALAKAHSWHGKVIDYVIGGIVGAVLGYLLSLFA